MDREHLANKLWPHGSGPDVPQAYALLDGARDPAIEPMIRASGLPCCCLFAGTLSDELRATAPFLVQLAPQARFFADMVREGWGKAWGMFAVAKPDVTLQFLRKHFRTLLQARDSTGQMLAFRYYDPRVLQAYLPACNQAETAQFHGPVDAFFLEAPDRSELLAFDRMGSQGRPRGSNGFNGLNRDVPVISALQMAALRDNWLSCRLFDELLHRGQHAQEGDFSPDLSFSRVRELVAQARSVGLATNFNIASFVMLAADEHSPLYLAPQVMALLCQGETPDASMGRLLQSHFLDALGT